MMLRNGAKLLTLQRHLGHASPAIVKKYANVTDIDVRRDHAKYAPLATKR